MKESYDAESFKNILIGKGYDDHFVITVCHFGKLGDNLNAFIKSYQSGGIDKEHGLMLFTTCIKSDSVNQSSIKCDMCMDYNNGKFAVHRMIIYEEGVSKSLKPIVMDVTTGTLPTASDAIAMAMNPELKDTQLKKGIRFK
ncbi:hypothetical protein [Sphingobacterium sp. UGAL515B_05]|uniref:hypothetical protein n=1 Tax=Sphingobacterium sp. UGAL515B_05 TaxID=2986767 RepID=UPI002952CFB8|nr:hypothetical protein [Sphingobacterium sp. UGAL515B_05]WON94379.1 hypothetical protein OK025_24430 [Sphingobacterium sp. UGAL515B_05]